MIDVVIKLADVLAKHKVEYLFIGKFAAMLYGYPGTTQDIDVFPKKGEENSKNLVSSLKELGFAMDDELMQEIIKGKDFIQIRGGPFPIDLIFAPDGIEFFEDAKKRGELINGKFHCASINDIIASKESAKRQRDKEELPRLKAFREIYKKKI